MKEIKEFIIKEEIFYISLPIPAPEGVTLLNLVSTYILVHIFALLLNMCNHKQNIIWIFKTSLINSFVLYILSLLFHSTLLISIPVDTYRSSSFS